MEPLGTKSGPLYGQEIDQKKGEISLPEKIKGIIDDIVSFQNQIERIKGQGSVLEKIQSLSELKVKILNIKGVSDPLEQKTAHLITEKAKLLAEITLFEEQLSKIKHPIWGRQEHKYLNELAKRDLTKLNSEAHEIENELHTLNQKKEQINQEIEELERMTQPYSILICQALEEVQASLEQLNKITLIAHDYKIEIPLEGLINSSVFFKKYYESGMLGSESTDFVFKGVDNYEKGDVEAFLNFFNSSKINLTEDNVGALLSLADRFGVQVLVNQCMAFLKENASWEQFPELLQLGLELNQPELIWFSVNLAMKDREALAKKDFKNDESIQEFSDSAKEILYDLEKMAQAKTRFIFLPSLGHIDIASTSDDLHLKNLGNVVPLYLQIGSEISIEDFDSFANQCPWIEHLIVAGQFSHDKETLLSKFPKLKSFGNVGIKFKSIDEVIKYQEALSPIEVSGVNLFEIKDIQDSDLNILSKNLKNLKQLMIKSSEITTIPFEGLELILCDDCTSLVSFDASQAKWVSCNNCPSLISLNASQAYEVRCQNCIALLSLDASLANYVDCYRCESLVKLIVGLVNYLNCSFCKSLEGFDASQVKHVISDNCDALKILDADQAESVECDNCPLLEILIASQAKDVSCMLCKSLKSLILNKAERIRCHLCTSLISLEANQAKNIFSRECTALLSLSARQAENIDCRECPSNINLMVSPECKAQRI